MNKLTELSNPPEDQFITKSLQFAATLVCLDFKLVDTITSSNGAVSFVFESQGQDIQAIYDQWHINDIPVGSRRFSTEWRKLRRLIDAVRE